MIRKEFISLTATYHFAFFVLFIKLLIIFIIIIIVIIIVYILFLSRYTEANIKNT